MHESLEEIVQKYVNDNLVLFKSKHRQVFNILLDNKEIKKFFPTIVEVPSSIKKERDFIQSKIIPNLIESRKIAQIFVNNCKFNLKQTTIIYCNILQAMYYV